MSISLASRLQHNPWERHGRARPNRTREDLHFSSRSAAYFASPHFPGHPTARGIHFVGPETPDRGFLGAAGNTVGLRPHLPRSHIKCRHWTHGMSAAGPGHSGNQA